MLSEIRQTNTAWAQRYMESKKKQKVEKWLTGARRWGKWAGVGKLSTIRLTNCEDIM